ncbi:MAG: metallophosphoesterase family protein [Deltaproteobacteria bacterium]|nr:metallophosphoesterase family protein [Deltaproteobacteria bacterium]MBW1929476.1 metallophosphoesterase family protein [Deltaproteobacteria bacterium]MBW2023865.1 metallophosphoesterase family protein [Deltaproteobacteria bacterium]MBW2124154.1 metallophosphoesterase family protein [Deltaproteobacteria bacterium]
MAFRIGVISDTHLHRVTKEFERLYEEYLADKDLIVHAGDIVSMDVVEFLSRKPLKVVSGNMDPVEVRKRLPSKEVIEIEGFRIGLIHGWGAAADLERRVLNEFRNVDVIIYGHSHYPFNEVMEGVLMFNPGTATGYASAGFHSLGILDVEDTVKGEIIKL